MAETLTTTTTLTEIVPKIIARTLTILQSKAGILSTLRLKDMTGAPGRTCDFPVYTQVTSAEVEVPGEGTANTNVIDLETNAHLATLSEHKIVARITDAALDGALEPIIVDTSNIFASAVGAKLEDDVVNLFGSFSQTIAGAGTALSELYIFDAIRQIRAANGDPRNLVGVLSPKQYYGEKGLRKIASDGAAARGDVGEDMKKMGFVDNIYGIDWLVSNEIEEDVSSGGDAAGGIYQRGAIGLAHKQLIKIELARGNTGGEAGYTSLICTGTWGEVEIENGWGVYALSDVS